MSKIKVLEIYRINEDEIEVKELPIFEKLDATAQSDICSDAVSILEDKMQTATLKLIKSKVNK